MAKNRNNWVIPVIVLVFGMVAVGVYAAEPLFNFITEQIKPDAESAVVYFVGGRYTSASIWDGDKPIGNYAEKKIPNTDVIVPYKTTPGEHYFMFNATNWVALRANLEPNKRYVIRVEWIPAPFATIVVVNPGTEDLLNTKKARTVVFTDSWRANFAKGKALQEVQAKLKEAVSENIEVTLTSANGF
jgi:hypothetical protein